jgi:tetratricopeptide (TPR) repeat protein
VLLGLLLCPSAPARADILTKTDGTRLEGEVKREGDVWVVTQADGKRITVPPGEVRGIELTGKPGAAADAGLASLRRSGETQTDPARMVERYKQFIEMHKGTSAAEEAALDLATWETRLARGMRKVGSEWLDSEEAERQRAGATDLALSAIGMLRESRLAQAEEAIAQSLAADPGNPTALYLRGILLYRQDKFADARRAFEQTLQRAPAHGPTLANLAVTAFRLNQWGIALNNYDQALIAMPLERGLLNNLAEAFNTLPDNQKSTPLGRRVQRKFTEQDTLLAQRLAQLAPPNGPLFRWGATWVNQNQLNEIRAAEAKIKTELDQLAGQYDQLARRLTGIDTQIRQNTQDMQRYESQSFGTDANGNVVRLPLPQVYYTLRNQTDALRNERTQVEAQQAQLRNRAREVQKQTPIPQFTGIQQLYAAEAAPRSVPPPRIAPGSEPPAPASAPTTIPTTQP